MLRTRTPLFEAVFALLTIAAAVPLWLVSHPPIEDLPQHLAVIRILRDYSDPWLHFRDYFELQLGNTQYLTYYLFARVLAVFVDVEVANKLLLTGAIVGTPYAMRSLLRSLQRDEHGAVFVLPLVWNAHLILGFFNFVAAIPLCLWGLKVAVDLRDQWRRARMMLLAVICVTTFYTHVVPFAFLALGVVLVSWGEGWTASFRRWIALVPSAIAMLLWMSVSPAGKATLTAASGASEAAKSPQFATWMQAFHEIPMWLTDVLHSERDEQLLFLWMILLLVAFVLGVVPVSTEVGSRDAHGQWVRDRMARRIGLLSPLAAVAYFITPTGYDWIWPINARFPLLASLFLISVLPRLRTHVSTWLHTAVVVIALTNFQDVARAFQRFESEEVGDFDRAVDVIPQGSRVAGLIFDRGSSNVKFSPFLHYVAWVQARKGGAVMFTFADFPQSPFHFRESSRPPRVVPRWEWMPEQVDPRRDLSWFQYVIVRGGPGAIQVETDAYEPIYRDARWSVWKRR